MSRNLSEILAGYKLDVDTYLRLLPASILLVAACSFTVDLDDDTPPPPRIIVVTATPQPTSESTLAITPEETETPSQEIKANQPDIEPVAGDPGVFVITFTTDGPALGTNLQVWFAAQGEEFVLLKDLGVREFGPTDGPTIDMKSKPEGDYVVEVLARGPGQAPDWSDSPPQTFTYHFDGKTFNPVTRP